MRKLVPSTLPSLTGCQSTAHIWWCSATETLQTDLISVTAFVSENERSASGNVSPAPVNREVDGRENGRQSAGLLSGITTGSRLFPELRTAAAQLFFQSSHNAAVHLADA